MNNKDESIIKLIQEIQKNGIDANTVDYWEADRFAIGLVGRHDKQNIVYVSTFGNSEGLYNYECETRPKQVGAPFSVAERGRNISYNQLVEVLVRHLR